MTLLSILVSITIKRLEKSIIVRVFIYRECSVKKFIVFRLIETVKILDTSTSHTVVRNEI